jgi:two-component sensor histidine kinase
MRIVQEAVTNALKHAGAGNISIDAELSDSSLRLRSATTDAASPRMRRPAAPGRHARAVHAASGPISS